MTSWIVCILQCVFIVIYAADCKSHESSHHHSRDTNKSTSISPTHDPCSLVLVPHKTLQGKNTDEVDKNIVRCQQQVRRSRQAVSELERLGWAYVAKARDSRDDEYYTLAELTAQCIEVKSDTRAESMLLRGHVYHNQHRFADAEHIARRLTKQRGHWLDHALLGDVLIERGKLNEAAVAYQEVVDQRPGPQAYLRIGQIRWLKGDLEGAIEILTRAMQSTSPRTKEPAAWVQVRLAVMLMQAGEFARAESLFKQALALQPDYPPALHALGRLLLAEGKLEDALPVLKQAVKMDPLLEFRRTFYEALLQADLQEAAQEQKSVILKHGMSEDRRTFALFMVDHGTDPALAVRLALQELEARADVFTLDAVAWALHGAGREDEAYTFCQKALAEGTQDARLFLHSGVIADGAGDKALARKMLAGAKDLQQMLLPSERDELMEKIVELSPPGSTPDSG